MEVWASIDLLEGKVVRLVKGDIASTIVYSTNPLHVAKKLESLGFDGIHIVNLDAALGIGEDNTDLIKEIVSSLADTRIQVGGGLRSREAASALLEMGVDRVVIGTLIFTNSEVVSGLVGEYGAERIVAALDHQGGRVVYRGWKKSSDLRLSDGYKLIRELGLKYVLATSVERDGTLMGPDRLSLMGLTPEERGMTYVSGGISSPEDVKELSLMGVRGVIIGRAIYEDLIPPSEFVRTVRER